MKNPRLERTKDIGKQERDRKGMQKKSGQIVRKEKVRKGTRERQIEKTSKGKGRREQKS